MWPFSRSQPNTEVVTASKASGHKWPDCAPIDKADPYWEINNNLNVNGVNYLKREVSPGRWQWVQNEEANRRQHEYEKRKDDLYFALQTRALTTDEEIEALGYGSSLNIRNMVSYRAEEKSRELQNAWFQQRRLQLLARSPLPPPSEES